MTTLNLNKLSFNLANVWKLKKVSNIVYRYAGDQITLRFNYLHKDKLYNIECSQLINNDIKVLYIGVDDKNIQNYKSFTYSKHARFSAWGGFFDKLNRKINGG